MPAYVPLFVRADGRTCAVVGGGRIGGERALRMAAWGVGVRLISPAVTPAVADAVARGAIGEHRARAYRAGDLDGCALAVAATASRDVNRAVLADARRAGIPCNVADDARAGDFIVPATVRRGDLVIAVTTGGASPAVAAEVRRRLEVTFGPEWSDLLALLGDLRDDLRARHPDPDERAACVMAVLDSEVHAMLSRADRLEAERLARTLLELGE